MASLSCSHKPSTQLKKGQRKIMGIMDVSDYTIRHLIFGNWLEAQSPERGIEQAKTTFWSGFDLLSPVRNFVNRIEVKDADFAHWLCKIIPAQCPFARSFTLFGRTLFTIPPLCKLNPFYEELMALRFRALCYLADECGEDIAAYC